MDEIIYRQQDAAKKLDTKGFVLAVAGVVLRLAIAQIVVNLLISATGTGLLNLLFYAYAVYLVFGFMRRTVASCVYTLKRGVIYLERKLGDSTNTLVEIPLCRVISMRPVKRAEKLSVSYRQVTVIDPACKPGARMRAAFAASYVSARLARLLAGRRAQEQAGWVIVFTEGSKRHACVFSPDEALVEALREQLGEAFGFDERMTQAKLVTLQARALQRAFGALYPFVNPLVKPDEIDEARAQIDRQKAARAEKRKAKKQDAERAGAQKPEETREPEPEKPEEATGSEPEENTTQEKNAGAEGEKRRRRKQE